MAKKFFGKKRKARETCLAGLLSLLLMLTGCGGMHDLKKRLNNNPSMYVMTGKQGVTLFLDDIGGGEIIDRIDYPEATMAIEAIVKDILKERYKGAAIKTSTEFNMPKKESFTSFDDGGVPDWRKTDFNLIVLLDTHFTYIVIPSAEGVPPYRYKLRAATSMSIARKTMAGEIAPFLAKPRTLAMIEATIPLETGDIRGIKSIMKTNYPVAILARLKEGTAMGLKSFFDEEGL